MDDDFRPAMESATPEHLQVLLRDHHRQVCGYDPEADRGAQLSFSMTVAQWKEALDLIPRQQLADVLNQEWGIQCPHNEWKAVLEPDEERTLKDVCNLLARYVKLPKVEPMGLLGASCLPAGAFLIVRSLLRDAGADPSKIAPSTPLASYARAHRDTFLGPISRLAPGALPTMEIRHPFIDLALKVVDLADKANLAGLLLIAVGFLVGWPWITYLGALTIPLSFFAKWCACHPWPTTVEFGELKTFRDLSMAIALAHSETDTHAKQS
jgi:hypothetical protein